jgi:hypothetical protein
MLASKALLLVLRSFNSITPFCALSRRSEPDTKSALLKAENHPESTRMAIRPQRWVELSMGYTLGGMTACLDGPQRAMGVATPGHDDDV